MDKPVGGTPALDEVDLSLPLSGNEGLDVNYISRVRTQYLFAQHQALLTQVQFADAKAIALVTLVGIMLFRGPISIQDLDTGNWAHLGFLGLGFVALAFCLIAVVPRYPSRAARVDMARKDQWSWPALTADRRASPKFARFMQTAEVSQLVQSVALSNLAVSRILLTKFTMLRIAFLSSVAALAFLLIDLIAGFA